VIHDDDSQCINSGLDILTKEIIVLNRAILLWCIKKGAFYMSTKVKAFIGITVSFIILIILFTSTGGFRGSRADETDAKKMEESCSVEKKVEAGENIVQAEETKTE
jgi:hypothetical protein